MDYPVKRQGYEAAILCQIVAHIIPERKEAAGNAI